MKNNLLIGIFVAVILLLIVYAIYTSGTPTQNLSKEEKELIDILEQESGE